MAQFSGFFKNISSSISFLSVQNLHPLKLLACYRKKMIQVKMHHFMLGQFSNTYVQIYLDLKNMSSIPSKREAARLRKQKQRANDHFKNGTTSRTYIT